MTCATGASSVSIREPGGTINLSNIGPNACGPPLPRAGQREAPILAVQGGGVVWGVDRVGEGGDGVRNSKLQHPSPTSALGEANSRTKNEHASADAADNETRNKFGWTCLPYPEAVRQPDDEQEGKNVARENNHERQGQRQGPA